MIEMIFHATMILLMNRFSNSANEQNEKKLDAIKFQAQLTCYFRNYNFNHQNYLQIYLSITSVQPKPCIRIFREFPRTWSFLRRLGEI